MRFFYALHLIHEGMGLIIGYLSLVSLHFFHPNPSLRYVPCLKTTLRPEIRCYLWQPLLRLVFGIWLIYRRRSVSSSRRCFFDAWRWFSVGCRRLLHFYGWYLMLFSFQFYCTSDIHTRAYSPFICLRWAPSGALSLSLGIFIDQRSLVEHVEMISVLVEHFLGAWAFSSIKDP